MDNNKTGRQLNMEELEQVTGGSNLPEPKFQIEVTYPKSEDLLNEEAEGSEAQGLAPFFNINN